MFVVTVRFDLRPESFADFMPLMRDNARRSLEREPGCRVFDVCTEPAGGPSVFLYEVYDDRAAFDAHLASAHFQAFDAATSAMIVAKSVQTWRRESSGPHG